MLKTWAAIAAVSVAATTGVSAQELPSMGAEILGDESVNSEALRAQVDTEVERWKAAIGKAGVVAN